MNRTRRLVNRLGDVAFAPPLDRLWGRSMRGRVTGLLYHRVADPDEDAFLARGGTPAVRPEQLARELRFLGERGARFVTYAELRDGWFPAADEIAVIVSFDDGFRSNYESGLEVLTSLGIRAVFFQITGLVDADRLLWEHALYRRTCREPADEQLVAATQEARPELDPARISARELALRLRTLVPGPEVERILNASADASEREAEAELAARLYPGAAMIRRARDLGHEIGSHGHRHYRRSTIDDRAFEADLTRSIGVLESLLGEPPAAYAYPFNSYRAGDDAIVGRHFAQAVTVDRRRIAPDADPLWLPRFSWPGPPGNALRQRRWLLSGTI